MVGFFCFVSSRAWKQEKPTPLDRGAPLHVNWPLNENSLDDNGLFLWQKLSDISAIKGFKIVHQSIRGLTGRIDELRLIVSELRSSLQFGT